DPCPAVVDGFCDLGVMSRQGTTFRLLYTARLQFGPVPADHAEQADFLRIRLIARPGRSPATAVTFRGQPAAGAVVKAFPQEGAAVELKADAEGWVEYPGVAEGCAGLLAKWTENAKGERGGKSYGEVRYYATLTVAPATARSASTAPTSRRVAAGGTA